MLLLLLIAGAQALYHPDGSEILCLDYSEVNKQATAELVAEVVECTGNKAVFVGWMCNVKACAAAVQNLGGTLFKWGGDGSGKFTTTKNYRVSKAGRDTVGECWMEEQGVTDCKPQKAQFDVYKVVGGPIAQKATLIKKSVECKSSDVNLSKKGGVLECANAVKARGGKYFIFSRPREGKEYQCWMENTNSASCPEGWESDAYDFWQVGGGNFKPKAEENYTCRGKCGGGRSCHAESGQCRRNQNVAETSCRGACSNSCCNMKTIRCEICGTFTEEEQAIGLLAAAESRVGEPASNMDTDARYSSNYYGTSDRWGSDVDARYSRNYYGNAGEGYDARYEGKNAAMSKTEEAVTMKQEPATGPGLVIYAFAALGAGFLVYGSYQYYCAKHE